MTIYSIIVLVGVMIPLALMPSTSVAIVVSRSVAYGYRDGIATAMGIVMADLVFVVLAIVGLTALSSLMGSLFVTVKYIAAIYLFWFGYRLLTGMRSADNAVRHSTNLQSHPLIGFGIGFCITLGDIKAILFYGSLFPTLFDIEALGVVEALTIMAVTALVVGSIKVAYALLASKVVNCSCGNPMSQPAQKIAGGLMLGAGTYLFFKP